MSKLDDLIQELCPNGVPFQKINDVSVARRGKWIKSNNLTPGDVPVITSAQESLYTHNTANSTGKVVVVASSGAYAGFISYFDTPIYLSNVFAFDVDKSKIDAKFLYYVLKSRQQEIHDMKSGGGVPNVYAKDVGRLKIPVPPLGVQREIINILDKFTQFEAELSAELGTRREQYEYYRNQLLTFDHSVSVKKLHEISEIYDSLHQTPKYSGEGWPMIRVTDIKGGYVDIESALKVDRETFEVFTKKYKPQFNDIVVSRVGSYGNFSLIGNNGEVCLGQNTAIMHPLINARYLYHVLHSSSVTKFIENNVGGGSQKTISLATIKEIPIHVPSPEEQARIVDILDKFDSLTSSISEGIPAEINARQKQYEYYRTKLLTFQELSA